MRISELARESGLTVATIKYYLREGLLPPGQATSPTQAEYGQEHLERLRLVRALVEVGRLPLATVQAVLAALSAARTPPSGPAADTAGKGGEPALGGVIGTVYAALPPHPRGDGPEPVRAIAAISALGWRIPPGSPGVRQLEEALAAVESVGLAPSPRTLGIYAAAALSVATADIGSIPDAAPAEIVRHVVVGTVLYEPILSALRRLAIQHVYVTGPAASN